MEFFGILALLADAALVTALIVALVVAYSRIRSLRERVDTLEDRLISMGAQQPLRPFAPQAAPEPGPSFTPAPSSAAPYRAPYIPVVIPATGPEAKPVFVPAAAPPQTLQPAMAFTAHEPKAHVSLEARLGQNWLNKLGITALVIGLALGLGKLITHIGPLGKDAIGLVLALGLLSLGVFLERRPTYTLFARVLIGGGWAFLFFLAFALYHVDLLRVLTSQVADLGLMFLVAGGMVAHSLRYRSQTVTAIAFLLAFVTVGLSQVTLFSLLASALLAIALAAIVYRERWYALGFAGLIGVYFNHLLWLHRVLPEGGIAYLRTHGRAFPEFVPSALLLLTYWLIFRLVYVLRPPLGGPQQSLEQKLSTVTAILNAAGLCGLLKYQSSHPEWAFYGLIALGIAELSLALVARGSLRPDDDPQPNRLAFVTLSTLAGVFLIAAVPFRFHGNSWSLFWLLEAEAFFLTGLRLPERIFRRLGIAIGLLVAAVLIFVEALIFFEAAQLSTGIHSPVPAAVFFSAALVLWFNAEFAIRRWRALLQEPFDSTMLRASSFAAAILAALGLTVSLSAHASWLAPGWLALALVVGLVADKLGDRTLDLASQADLLALAALFRALICNTGLKTESAFGISTRLLTLGITALLLYLSMRRRAASCLLPTGMVAAAYSWAAAFIAGLLCWYQLGPVVVAVAWGFCGLILFELGGLFRRSYLRHQGYALLSAAFVRIFFANMQVTGAHGGLSPSLYTVVPLIAAFVWIYERSRSSPEATRFDHLAGIAFAWCSVVAAATLLYFELRPAWLILGWTALSIVLLALACILKRTVFVAQSLLMLLAATLRGLLYQLLSPTPLATDFSSSRVFTVGLTAAMMLAALSLAFYWRGLGHPASDSKMPSWLARILPHPEQPVFFAPLALLTLLLYVQLRGGVITIGWVALGVCTFLFALAVNERSYRLGGLGLLMLAVAKVLLWDVWHASPTDRYLTLIIMGASLLLVSFLYSRYKETLLKFL